MVPGVLMAGIRFAPLDDVLALLRSPSTQKILMPVWASFAMHMVLLAPWLRNAVMACGRFHVAVTVG